MSKNPQIQPRPPRTILFVLFHDFQLLDVTGPLTAFEIAARYVPGAYKLRLASRDGGSLVSSSGIALETEKLSRFAGIDTVMISGGDGTRQCWRDEKLINLIKRADNIVPRMASVCSGALLLARAGLLEGRRATTHWSRVRDLTKHYPNVRVEPDSIWVRDGKYWTSAGITAGIDLALAMISEDLGADVARDVARQMVVYAQRPGGQTQHSQLLELGAPTGRFAEFHAWMRDRLASDLCVEKLAAKAGMSERNFTRAYTAETGVTPAKAVERLRVEAARALIESGAASLDQVARQSGFGDQERMRRAFIRLFGAPPSSLRRARA